jgi:hypothetical protein
MKTRINVFDLAGNLLTIITNPATANNDYFACAMASVSNQLLIGANMDDSGATNAGIVYLFTVGGVSPAAPWLSITLDPQLLTINVSWPSPSTNWQLQQNTNSLSPVNWSDVTDAIQDDGTTKSLIVNPPTGNRFYRLHKP